MRRKVLFVALLASALFVAKGYLFKLYLQKYVSSEFSGKCLISKADIYWSGVKIEGFDLKSACMDCSARGARLDVRFTGLLHFYISDIRVENASADIKNANARFEGLNIKAQGQGRLELSVRSFVINDKETKDLSLPFELADGRIIFPRSNNAFLGADSLFEGSLDYKGMDNICVNLKVSRMSLKNIMGMFTDPEGFEIGGAFDGELKACKKAGRFQMQASSFKNGAQGFIHIKNESSIVFLKSYLDPPSFKALVDNFRNYTYNIGTIDVDQKGNDLVLLMGFDSADMGHRSVSFVLHDILGGRQ